MKFKKRYLLLFALILLFGFSAYHYNGGVEVEELYPSFKTPESKLIAIEGMPLHYRVTGSGPHLILLHGVASSLHTWEGWQEILSDSFTVVSIDLPSFGLTGPHPENDYSVAMYMRVLDQLMQHLKIEKTFIAGNSFGGFLAWNYALHKPERVEKIALLDAGGIRSNRSDITDLGFKLSIWPLTKNITHYITPRFIIKKSVKNVYGDQSKVSPELIDRYVAMLMRKGNRQGFSEVLGKTILDGIDKKEQIKKVAVPTLIMWGDQDRILKLEDGKIFNQLITGSELIVYKGVGHVPMEEIPEQSAKDLRAFLEK